MKLGSRPTITEFLSAVLAVFMAYSGFTVAVVFLVTKPPAVQYLTGDTLIFGGIATLVGGVYLGWKQVVESFFPPRPPHKSPP
jgi:xanthine/uracil permease